MLPDVDADDALRWLADCAFSDARAGGVTLHELVAGRTARSCGSARASCAPAPRSSLHARGELIDLADLVQDPAIRSGFGWDGSIDHHVTGPQPGDEEVVGDVATRAFFEREPGHVLVGARPDGTPCGYSIAYAAGERPAVRDERLERWLACARADSIVWRDSVDLTRDPRSRVQALLNMATILRCGLRQPAVRVPPDRPRRARRGPSAPRPGRGTSRSSTAAASSATCSTTGRAGCSARCATACCARPGASRSTSARRCAACTYRARSSPRCGPSSRQPVRRAFGDTPDERLLRDVLVRGYFDPAASHEQTARELHLSRAAYFRRLRSASERVAAFMDSSSTT